MEWGVCHDREARQNMKEAQSSVRQASRGIGWDQGVTHEFAK